MNVGDHEVRSDTLKELEVSMTGKDESKPREDQEKNWERNVILMISIALYVYFLHARLSWLYVGAISK